MKLKSLFVLVAVQFLLLGSLFPNQSQKSIDSLLQVANTTSSDSVRATCYHSIGSLYKLTDMLSANDYLNKSIKLYEKLGLERDKAIVMVDLGTANVFIQQYTKASDLFLASKKIGEKLNDLSVVVRSVSGLASIYQHTGKPEKAIPHYKNAEVTYKHLRDTGGLIHVYNSMGICMRLIGDLEKSKEYYESSIKLANIVGETSTKTSATINLIIIYYSNGEVEKAINTGEDLLVELYEYGNFRNAAGLHSNLSRMYDEQGDLKNATKHIDAAIKLSEEKALVDFLPVIYHTAFVIYNNKKEFEIAIDFLLKEAKINDSIAEDNVNTLENKLEIEQKDKEIIDSKIAKRLADLKVENQKSKMMYLAIGISICLFVIVLLYFLFRSKQKANRLINKQKGQLEVKNKEITDSINYAKRIQDAILPPLKQVKEYLPKSFIFYKPKDIVAGDFYWMEATSNVVHFAAADCTGHGVPGALVSVVCSNALSKALVEEKITDVGKLLDRTKELVVKRFGSSEENIQDGMDVALCSLNTKTNELYYAGANNPLWIVRKGATEVEEIKPNKQPIGKYAALTSFVAHKKQLQAGDTIYIFSDGFQDQFGGSNSKKYKTGALKKLLLTIQDKDMDTQCQLLADEFESWRGNLEQIDDVCMIGVKI